MCSQTVTSQDSLILNFSGRKQSMSCTFCIEKANQEKIACMATTARFVW